MKIKITYFFLAIVCISCGGKSDPAPTPDPTSVQLGKLSATWKATSVKLNATEQTGYNNLQLILSGQKDAASFNYVTTGRPAKSPWPGNGTWVFGDAIESVIIRDKGTPDELTMNYAVSDHVLTVSFSYTGTGFIGGRQSVLNGQWVFTFSNQ